MNANIARIQHNIPAFNAYRNYSANSKALASNLEKLSTGYKINRAGDDAAGLAISEKMRAQITGLAGAQKNANDGISLIQTAEGAMTEVHSMLNRMVTLTEQSANGTYDNDVDRAQLQKEVESLKAEIDRIADSTNYNGLKLLDGSLAGKSTAFSVESSAINSLTNLDMTDGVTINAPTDGEGAKQSYSMKFDAGTVFGAGDSLTIDVKDNSTSVTTPTTISYQATNPNQYAQFNGDTLEAQLNNIASALNFQDTTGGTNGAAFDAGYEVTVEMNDDGSGSLVFTAKDVGATDFDITGANVTDAQSASTLATTAATNTAAAAGANMGWQLVGGDGSTNPLYVNSGDTLTFEFNVNGKTMYAQITEGEDFFLENSDTAADKASKITAALQDASFLNPEDGETIVAAGTDTSGGAFSAVTATGTDTVDESQMKVSDFFTLAANKDPDDSSSDMNGAIHVDQKAGTNTNGVYASVGSAYLTNAGGSTKKIAAATDTGSNGILGAANGAVTAESNVIDINGTAGQNMSAGEKFVVNGQLKDGRSFSIELTAAKNASNPNEFSIGASQADTATNIAAALANGNNKVTITDADGNTEEIAANKLFAASGTSTDFTASASGTRITIANVDKGLPGVGVAAKLDTANTGIVPGNMATVAYTAGSKGSDQAPSENLITFDPAKVEQGTSLTIDGKTYEFVTDESMKTKDSNVAVVVSNLGQEGVTGNDLANALKTAMDNDVADDGLYKAANGGSYSLNVDGNKLSIKSEDIGETVKALDMSVNANKPTTVFSVATKDAGTISDPGKKIAAAKAGDTITIGDKTYEFTEGNAVKDSKNIAVDLGSGENKLTAASDVAKKLAEVINAEHGSSDTDAGVVARADGEKVILAGKYNALAEANKKDAYAAPSVKLAGNGGLTLQIGDTGDDYNKLTVEVKDLHTSAMGIGDIDISTQEGAAEAMDKIKSAVNYVSDVRGGLGALQNRLEHTINNLGVMQENIMNAESAIRDVDVAEEMMAYTKNTILNQSAQAMLAQANQLPQGVLQLLG